ncbi:glycoside hydrolase family 71/99-like protein [Flavobacterium sp. W22_SRS_FP1]|uniref:glycoside hydrolase family 71/99-like protein n=1 Tax=Flavobacterium sp. W22_SRS_FP1 TaxID=3240276 RepID=UPI003F91E4FF
MRKIALLSFIICIISCSSENNLVENQGNNNLNAPNIPAPSPTALNVIKNNPTKVLMHYMPWFETNDSNNGEWGLHWTMAKADPNLINSTTGKRQIASFYYPIIGPYHSGDSAVIEYHLLLMKYSGVDAVVIDWYGTHNIYDYKINFDNSDQLIKRTKEVGIDFGIVYEPYITSNVENVTGQKKTLAAIDDLKFLKNNYFNETNYLKINNQTVFLAFGNNFTGNEWNSIFSSSAISPKMYFLQYLTNSDTLLDIKPSPGEYFWVNSSDSFGQSNWDINYTGSKISGAYPGFKDYYIEGGWTNNHLNWEIDLSVSTLRNRLDLTKKLNTNVVQVQTFNDFGEGTMMEPTVEFGFSFLNELQKFTGVQYSIKELELIYKYYLLKTKFKSTVSDSQTKEIFNYLITLKVNEAEALINKYYN